MADDFLKNDGRKFLDLMEQLAERKIRQLDAEAGAGGDGGSTVTSGSGANGYEDEDEDDYDDEEDYEDDEEVSESGALVTPPFAHARFNRTP